MQFKHPEILYALLLLIIPILVHLFQLQRFIKVPFTNVKILKNIEKQTRKSARLKKWLILVSRLLIFICLIFAFSQPYFSDYSAQQNFNTTIYLDNSFSMQAKGESGELLKNAAQKLIKNNTNPNSTISFLTNNKSLNNIDIQSLKNELINIKYCPNKLPLNTVLLKAQNFVIKDDTALNKIVLISDFQDVKTTDSIHISTVNSEINFIKLTPKNINNIYIDSVYIDENYSSETILKVRIKSSQNNNSTVPVSLFNNSKLLGKTTSKFNNSNSSIIQFKIPNSTNFNGKISLIDDALEFDNNFYFSISKPKKINVLSLGNPSEFLNRIYTDNEFNYSSTSLKNINYNNFQNQHLIILNELETISTELINALNEFSINGGTLVIIPSYNSNLDSYNSLLNKLNIGEITAKIEGEHKITTINYEHPLIKNVFEKKVANFQYPKTSVHYKVNFNYSSSIVKLDNNSPFISSIEKQKGNFYWIASSLNKKNSNFTQSPLIVPVFYNFAKKNLKTSQLYYTISPENKIEINTTLGKDDVLKVSNKSKTLEFIPLQTITQNRVILNLQEHILSSGFYEISNKDTLIKTVALNYSREESNLNSVNLETLIDSNNNVHFSPSIATIFNKINEQQKINWLFKWFLAFSILFLLIEMLILKYFNK